MTHACPPSSLPPLLEPLEPRLLLASSITINDPAISQGIAGTGTIEDDDSPPSLTVNDVQVTEGNAGTLNAVFTVTLSSVSGVTVTVNWATADGTSVHSATVADADYTPGGGWLTFNPGGTTKTVTVQVKGDAKDEYDETFNVKLSAPTNATIANATGVGTITDDDPLPALTINDVQVTEGDAGTVNAVFTVTLASVSGVTVTVNWATADGTAVSPADYTAASGILTFYPGQTTKTVTVAVKGDVVNEFDETFKVNLSVPINATVADGQGVGTIIDDDLAPSPLRWTGAADDHWENAANWYAGILPGPATTVGFDGPVLHPPTLYQDQEVRGLEFLSAGWIIRGQGHTLTVGAGGINSAGTGAVEPDVALGADSTWTLGNNSTLVLRGMLRGGGHTLTKDGAGTLVLAGGQDHTTGLALNVKAGTVQLAPAAGPLVLSSLSVAETGGAPTARLDIGSGSLIVGYDDGTASPLEDVKRWIAAGYNSMTWTGYGITSSAAALDPVLYGIAVADNASPNMLLPYGDGTLYPKFGNVTPIAVPRESVLVKMTYRGDVNLDGVVDDLDVAMIGLFYDGGSGPGGKAWFEGDINLQDGHCDDNDVALLGLTYGYGWLEGSPLGGAEGVTLAAPAEPAAQPAAALAPSPAALGAIASSPVAAVLPSETGLVDVARQEPRAPAASDAAASSGAEALLAAAGASVGSSGAVGPVAALEVTAMAPPPAWQSADRGERLPAADGGALDLLSLPALAVLAGA